MTKIGWYMIGGAVLGEAVSAYAGYALSNCVGAKYMAKPTHNDPTDAFMLTETNSCKGEHPVLAVLNLDLLLFAGGLGLGWLVGHSVGAT